MPMPPLEVPDGLSPEGYKRLATLYTLMGCQKQAVEAMNRCCQTADLSSEDGGKDTNGEPKPETGMREGMRFGLSLLKLLRKTTREMEDENGEHPRTSEPEEDEGDPIAEMRQQLLSLGVKEDDVNKYLDGLIKSLDELKNSEPPPREVPLDLDAAAYYELGLKYKEVGWTEQARDALRMAMEADPDGESGTRAQRFLRTKIPRFPVPLVAEQTNIRGFNQLFNGEQEAARETFEALIEEYPDFEWPYGNLGSLCIQLGELVKARRILKKALQINPHYVNAWLHLARAEALDERFSAAYECLERVNEIDPDDQNIQGIRQLIDQLTA